jgi:predicted nuclease of predicted toxin-antitoxin system
MRFLVDAQLPPALALWLATRGQEAQPVRDLGLRNAEDTAIRAVAQRENWVVITKDEDFTEQVLGRGQGPQVVWLRIGNCTNRALFAWLEPLWPAILRQLETGAHVIEVQYANE